MVTYHNGDLLESRCNVICHQVNCEGAMGSGIAKQIRERYPQVYETFRRTFESFNNTLGSIDVILVQDFTNKQIEDDLHRRFIINCYSQLNYNRHGETKCHTQYNAFVECLRKLKRELVDYIGAHTMDDGAIKKFTIGFPDHIGCGLAGGNWDIVKNIIEREFEGKEWEVEVWKL